MRVAVIGAGLIGKERIKSIKYIHDNINTNVELCSIYEPNEAAISKLEEADRKLVCSNVAEALAQKPDWVFVCTPHDVVIPIIKNAFENGANVLVEKPLGRSLQECEAILENKPANRNLYVGFNYRFFDGVEAALLDCKNGKFGKLISVNMILGHGNSPGMEKSWKLNLEKCGGGCLIDPGVHLLDLLLQISNGELKIEGAKSWSGFWNTGIEEETHFIFSDTNKTIFNVQISLNRWKSTFRIEINGSEGYGIVEGRGKSYGGQSYRTGKRWGWQAGCSQAASEEIVIKDSDVEQSFTKEILSIFGIQENIPTTLKSPSYTCSDVEASNVMKLLEKCREKL